MLHFIFGAKLARIMLYALWQEKIYEELMGMIKFIIVGKKWFDKVNGNTYHSARVYDLDRHIIAAVKYQYGYGDDYIFTAYRALNEAGIIEHSTPKHDEYFSVCHDNCKKQDVKYFGEVRI